MHSFSKLFLVALPFTAVVDGGSYWYSHHRRTVARSQPVGKTYMIEDLYQGDDFFKDVPPIVFQLVSWLIVFHSFSDWTFEVGADPTGGNVIYQSQSDAQSKGLAYVNPCDNSLVLAVDSTSTVAAGGQRASCVKTVFIVSLSLIAVVASVLYLRRAMMAVSLSSTPPSCL
jgi:hypothetical protein